MILCVVLLAQFLHTIRFEEFRNLFLFGITLKRMKNFEFSKWIYRVNVVDPRRRRSKKSWAQMYKKNFRMFVEKLNDSMNLKLNAMKWIAKMLNSDSITATQYANKQHSSKTIILMNHRIQMQIIPSNFSQNVNRCCSSLLLRNIIDNTQSIRKFS